MKRFLTLLIILLMISIISFGCTNNDTQENDNGNQSPPTNEGSVENPNQNNQGTTDVTKELEGTFTGWIDNNSFEIISNDKPLAIRANQDLISSDDDLDGKKIHISYTTNEQGQNILKSIELID